MILSTEEIRAAFGAHTAGQHQFTRRMAVNMADMDGTTPKMLVLRLESLGLLKPGSWEWFCHHGGITADHVEEARVDRTVARALQTPANGGRDGK